MLFSFFKSRFNYTMLPCSIPVLLPEDILQSAQTKWSNVTERPKAFGLMCICSMLTSWKGKQWRQAFLCSVQMTAAAFHLLCEIPVFTRQPWCQEHLMAHRQVYLPSVSLTSRNQLPDCLGSSCSPENWYQCPCTSVFSSWAAPGSS